MIQMAKVLNKYIPSEWAFKNQFNHGIINIVAESTFLPADTKCCCCKSSYWIAMISEMVDNDRSIPLKHWFKKSGYLENAIIKTSD